MYESMPSKSRLSAKALTNRLYDFLTANRDSLSQLRITTEAKDDIAVTMLRCNIFERFLTLLEERMFVAKWGNQHDAFKVFLNVTLLGGNLSQLEKYNAHRVLVDILHVMGVYELKTKQAISLGDVPAFIEEYLPEIIAHQGEKTHWWLVFFVQRADDPQSTLGGVCSYYLVLIEIRARDLVATADCRQYLTTEVMTLVQQVEKRVREEDQVKKGIFAPVDNYIMVERLRKRVKDVTREKDAVIQEKDAVIQEKDAVIQEKDAVIQEKEVLIKKLQEELKKRKEQS